MILRCNEYISTIEAMKELLALLIFIISIQVSTAQATSDTIEIRRQAIYAYNDKFIATNHLAYILRSNPDADKEMTIATNNLTCSKVIAYSGGIIVGIAAVRFIMQGGGEYVRLAIAGGLVASISVPFSYAYKSHSKKAVLIYNEGLKHPPVSLNEHEYSIGIGPTSNGIGITVSF